jgi:hypothetical protein
VVLQPDTLRRAAGFMRRTGSDHLAAGPHVDMPGVLLQSFGVVFLLCFVAFLRPWRVSNPRSRSHVGIGAFNLLRSEAYRQIGGHLPIRMRPDDDLKLGKLVKLHGLRQGFVSATGHVRVEWYHTLGGAVRGLRKNAFSGVEYQLWAVVLSTTFHLLLFCWPFLALLLTGGATLLLNAGVVALILIVFAGAAREQRIPVWYGVTVPLTSLIFVLVMWNSALYTLRHRGIEWRGTHYPLDQLRANRVPHGGRPRVARHALSARPAAGEPGSRPAPCRGAAWLTQPLFGAILRHVFRRSAQVTGRPGTRERIWVRIARSSLYFPPAKGCRGVAFSCLRAHLHRRSCREPH